MSRDVSVVESRGYHLDSDVDDYFSPRRDDSESENEPGLAFAKLYRDDCQDATVLPSSQYIRQIVSTSINLENSFIGPNGADPLVKSLNRCQQFTTLNLNGTSIGSSGAQLILDGLDSDGVLASLSLARNQLGDASFRLVNNDAWAPRKKTQAERDKELIAANQIAQGKPVAEEVKAPDVAQAKRLMVLPPLAESIARFITRSQLRELDLSSNGLTDAFVAAIGRPLCSLDSLNMSRNEALTDAVPQLIMAFFAGSDIRKLASSLGLSGAILAASRSGQDEAADQTRLSSGMALNFSYTGVHNGQLLAQVASAIPLTALSVAGNSFAVADLIAILQAVASIDRVGMLDLRGVALPALTPEQTEQVSAAVLSVVSAAHVDSFSFSSQSFASTVPFCVSLAAAVSRRGSSAQQLELGITRPARQPDDSDSMCCAALEAVAHVKWLR